MHFASFPGFRLCCMLQVHGARKERRARPLCLVRIFVVEVSTKTYLLYTSETSMVIRSMQERRGGDPHRDIILA